MEKQNLKQINTETLLQMYANANSTCSCGGHHKGAMNEDKREKYALELRERGVIVPKDLNEKFDKSIVANVEIPKGVFNGLGSY